MGQGPNKGSGKRWPSLPNRKLVKARQLPRLSQSYVDELTVIKQTDLDLE